MTHSEPFAPAKYGGFRLSNDYLLKHGGFFGFQPLSCRGRSPDLPLDFAIKQERPGTPPLGCTSPLPGKAASPPDQNGVQLSNGQAKNAVWILGKQKLSWDNSAVASYNPDTKMFRCVVCSAVGFLSRIAEHYLGTHTAAKVFQCPHCPYSSTWSRCVRMHMAKHHGVPNAPPSLWKGQPLLEEIFRLLTDLKTTVDSQGRDRQMDPELCDKKFVCPKCPYTTDRRDLYVRHENIHKEDKPYHCYVCFKLFNRADHVKKHFLRIHRGHPYDISLVRRRPPRHPGHQTTTNTPTANTTTLPIKPSDNFMMDKIISSTTDHKTTCDPIDLTQHDPVGESKISSSKKLKTFQCPLCPWEGVDSWCLRRHMNVHLKSFECPVCEFKAGKAERLFTHVYKAHKKLVCTKCKFVTDQAHDFEIHVKDCCLDVIVGNIGDKTPEDSPNDSDEDFKPILTTTLSDSKFDLPKDLSMGIRRSDPPTPLLEPPRIGMDMKASVSLLPLHNSVSYCFPTTHYAAEGLMNGYRDRLVDVASSSVEGEVKGSGGQCKMEIKAELASPVQSSSDSGVADMTSDNNDLETTCWECGCEFADESSLKTHAELYHAPDLQLNSTSSSPLPTTPTPKNAKKFSCAICNFTSDRQRTIIEHMRFHTGEVLPCRAGQCTFQTVCDSTLEHHVRSDHSDALERCPHCGLACRDRVTFIRHYRKCHHSKSCLRCKDIKRGLSSKISQVVVHQEEDFVRPYLHHNPYSKKRCAVQPYVPNAAMFKVAVVIPQTLQKVMLVDESHEHKPRKQSAPRKLLHPLLPSEHSGPPLCDSNNNSNGADNKRSILKTNRLSRCPPLRSLNGVFSRRRRSVSNVSTTRFGCRLCSRKFKYRYQILLHKRKEHELRSIVAMS